MIDLRVVPRRSGFCWERRWNLTVEDRSKDAVSLTALLNSRLDFNYDMISGSSSLPFPKRSTDLDISVFSSIRRSPTLSPAATYTPPILPRTFPVSVFVALNLTGYAASKCYDLTPAPLLIYYP